MDQAQPFITISVYRRNNDVLQVEARHDPRQVHYVLTCRYSNGTNCTEAFHSGVLLYERLRSLGQKLSCDGWTMLPRERRAMNRLAVPVCSTCSTNGEVRVFARTDADVYFGCATCGAMWAVPKPGVPLPR